MNRTMQEALEAADEVVTLRELSKLTNVCKSIPKEKWEQELPTHIRVAVLGNCSTQLLSESLFLMLLRRSLFADIYQGAFDQWEMEMLDPSSQLFFFQPQVVLFFFFVENISIVKEKVFPLIVSFAGKTGSRVIFIPFASKKEMLAKISVHFPGGESVKVVDVSPVEQYVYLIKGKSSFSRKYWDEFRFPFHPNYTALYSRFLSYKIVGVVTSLVKVVLTDLDDTLWQGTLAEDGLKGIVMDKSAVELQRFLVELRRGGVVLGVVSANDETDVLNVFCKMKNLAISSSDIAVWKCNFSPKYENILSIAEELCIGLQNICFLDNDPFQRHQVRKLLPEVIVPELPSEREHFLPYLKATGLFQIGDATEEDKQRTQFYTTEKRRDAIRTAAATLEDYYLHLNLKLIPELFHIDNIKRVHQLVMRTNQFNLTGQRHSREKLLSWMQREGGYCFVFSLSDCYGEYGRVGAIVALPVDNRMLSIHTWVLSCRALGRTVERAMFEHLLEWARSRSFEKIRGTYIPTVKNMLVAAFLDQIGFSRVEECNRKITYCFSTNWLPKLRNTFVKILQKEDE